MFENVDIVLKNDKMDENSLSKWEAQIKMLQSISREKMNC